MEIERLSTENIETLARLMIELWPESTFQEEYDDCERMLNVDTETAFLCRHANGEYIGFITLTLRTDYVEGTHSKPVGYVEGIYVKAAYRKGGVGRTLLAKGEEWCKEKGCVEIASDTELHNTLSQSFHQNAGFTEANRIVCYTKDLT